MSSAEITPTSRLSVSNFFHSGPTAARSGGQAYNPWGGFHRDESVEGPLVAKDIGHPEDSPLRLLMVLSVSLYEGRTRTLQHSDA